MARDEQDMVQDIITGIGDKFTDALKEMATIIKEPTPLEAAKLRQEQLLQKRKAEARVEEAKIVEQERQNRIGRCRAAGHKVNKAGSTEGKHGFRGNVNFDGCIRPQCIACQLQLPPFKAPDAAKQGSSVNEWFESLNLTEDILISWSKTSNPEWWERETEKAKSRAEMLAAFRATYEEPVVQGA